jgi:hypothetical protein
MVTKPSQTSGCTSQESDPDTSIPEDLAPLVKIGLLIKENQLATALLLFAAWQAGLFIEAAVAVQGVCA